MISILSFSGKHWLRGAGFWILFAVAIDGLAQAGSEKAQAPLKTYSAASAHNLLAASTSKHNSGARQVAKVAVLAFDPGSLSQAAFGDTDDTAQR